jgi:hypothetical protein
MTEQTELERQLDDFDPNRRRDALAGLSALVAKGAVRLADPGTDINLHAHSFYSYNAYGYSPSKVAWLSRKTGLAMAGIVDFDVLDGADEFFAAADLLGLKGCVSLESRVFVPEFADAVMNSPGEPGVAYHMGVGFPRRIEDPFLAAMRASAAARTRDMIDRVNPFLAPVAIDFDADVRPLTPSGNATERHLCEAYERKAEAVFPDREKRAAFWRDRLGDAPETSVKLQALIRGKTMKKGGVGYVVPDSGSFPAMAEMNRFVLAAGAIPTLAWLDGTTDGEKRMEALFEVGKASGAAAINLIPDRNYTPGVADAKRQNLYDVVKLAEKHGFPIIVGTEMNAPGNKFVDDFSSDALKPLVPLFLKGAYIVFAHTVLQRTVGVGYTGAWAEANFASVARKNAFFEEAGRQLAARPRPRLAEADAAASPAQLLERLG